MYIHVPKEKRTKLHPLGNKSVFIRNSDTSKAYKIYFPRFKKIETIQDVTFGEDSTYNKSSQIDHTEIHEEPEVPKIKYTIMKEISQGDNEYHDMTEPHEPLNSPHEKKPYNR